jgi:D-alanyl-D-alanine endopeptidase (penicillin-binding protein 7)
MHGKLHFCEYFRGRASRAILLSLAIAAAGHSVGAHADSLAADGRLIVADARQRLHAQQRHDGRLVLRSDAALVLDADQDRVLYELRADEPRPVASLTKLMTAIVVLDAGLPPDEAITITEQDRDRLRDSRSRLRIGSMWSRHDLLVAALASSDNRAASALARSYPGGSPAFIAAMNAKAAALGMTRTHFADAAGLRNENVSTARDLTVLEHAAEGYSLVSTITTTPEHWLHDLRRDRYLHMINTNRLVRNGRWRIALSKTGFTSEAGYCLLMRTAVGSRDVVIVLLNSRGSLSKYGDSHRIRDWLLRNERRITASRPVNRPDG